MRPCWTFVNLRISSLAATFIMAAFVARPAQAQQDSVHEARFAFVYGIAFGSSTGIYSDLLGLTKLPARSVITAGVSPTGNTIFDATSRVGPRNGPFNAMLWFRASTLEQKRFYGVGNETTAERPTAYYDVEQYRLTVGPSFQWQSRGWRVAVGPSFDFVDTDSRAEAGITHIIGDPLPAGLTADALASVEDIGLIELTQPYGSGKFVMAGIETSIDGVIHVPKGGPRVLLRLESGLHPAVFDAREPFARLRGTLAVVQPIPFPGLPVLAVRGGINKVFGEAPFFDLAYLGGRSTLRGFPKHRFAGDAAFYSQVELSLRLGRASVLRPFDFGILALTDVGRVYSDGSSVGGWHETYGGGVWIEPRGGPPIALTLGHGAEGVRVYVGLAWR